MQSSPSRLAYPRETSKSDFECQFDQPSDDSGCPSDASESAESRSPSPELVVALTPTPSVVTKDVLSEVKPTPKKVIAPSVVPSKTGRNSLIEERMKRRTSFVKPVTKIKPVDPQIKYSSVCEAPSFSDCESEVTVVNEPAVVTSVKPVEPVEPESTETVQLKKPTKDDKLLKQMTAKPISKPDVNPPSITIAKITLPSMSNEIGQPSELTLNQ